MAMRDAEQSWWLCRSRTYRNWRYRARSARRAIAGFGAPLVLGLLILWAQSRTRPDHRLHLVRGRVASRSLSLPYAVWLPPGYSPRRRWPVLLFLHGFGERG